MKLEDAVRKIVKESFAKSKLNEGRTSDPIVDDTASAITHVLLETLEQESDTIGNNAFEMVMGSAPDEDRLTLGRFEDVDATAELIVQAVYRDVDLHDALHNIASSVLRSAMHAMGK
jgi:hypothetical protein